jgi:acyl-CoA thioester hydrolase
MAKEARAQFTPPALALQTARRDLRAVTFSADSGDRAGTGPRSQAHEIEFRVRYAETDQMGVVYHANYLVWCEMGRTDFIRQRGVSYAELERSGVALAVSDVTARFHAAARYDDLVRVRTTLAEARSRALVFEYVIEHAATGRRLVSARTSLVSIDSDGRPIAIPAEVRALFAE